VNIKGLWGGGGDEFVPHCNYYHISSYSFPYNNYKEAPERGDERRMFLDSFVHKDVIPDKTFYFLNSETSTI
jgi:hypothetical protein